MRTLAGVDVRGCAALWEWRGSRLASPMRAAPMTILNQRPTIRRPSETNMFDLSLTDEQNEFVATAREFTKREITPVAGRLDEEGAFPHDICRKAFEVGLMNLEVPEQYGGPGPWRGVPAHPPSTPPTRRTR